MKAARNIAASLILYIACSGLLLGQDGIRLYAHNHEDGLDKSMAFVLLRNKQDNTISVRQSFEFKARPVFSADRLPLFCKAEHKIYKQSGVNFRFRLGSLSYVDYLEQK